MHSIIPKDILSDKYLFDNSSICVYNYMYIYLYVYIVSNNPSVFAYGKSTVSAAASVGASASQRCPLDTRTL